MLLKDPQGKTLAGRKLGGKICELVGLSGWENYKDNRSDIHTKR